MILLATLASAAPVQCDPLSASRILAEARIDEARAPFTHSELIPGLAMASPGTEVPLRLALEDLCRDEGNLSLVATESWETATWSAHTFLLTRSVTEGCSLFQYAVAITVGVQRGAAPRYRLRSRLPLGVTPIEACATSARWYEERGLAGNDGRTRLVLATVQTNEGVQQSSVVARHATPHGWHDEVLMEPASARHIGGIGGPVFDVVDVGGTPWIVQHGDRTADPCEARPGEVLWMWDERAQDWEQLTGHAAWHRLSIEGLWRYTDHDGWMMIIAQDDLQDAALLEARADRHRRQTGQTLRTLPSSNYPELNPGFLVVGPGPYPTEEEAKEAREGWGRRTRTYIKRAWKAPNACAD